jgi:antitoxin component of RelBE/YafQ-DinJ toxin-antitoxin module
MKLLARINTWVPTRTKTRITALAKRTGLKTSDVIRIGLRFALDHFEQGPVELSTGRKQPERRRKMPTS